MPTGWKHTARFCLTAFCMDFATGMLLVVLPYTIIRQGGDSMSLGIAAALRGIGYGFSCLTLGHLADFVNRKILMAASVLCVAVSFLLIASAANLIFLYLAMVFWMIGLGPFWPSVFSWLAESHEPRYLGRATSAMNLSWSIGGMAGGIVAGWLFTRFGAIVFLLAVVPVLLAWLFLGLYACPHNRPERKTESGPEKTGSGYTLAAGLLAAFCSASLVGLTSGVFPAFGITIGIDAKIFGFLLACFGLGRTAVFLFGLRWNYFLGEWRNVLVIQLTAAVMVAGISIMPVPRWLVPAFLVTGLCLGTCYYRGLLSILEIPGSRGFRSGLFESTLLAGIMLGGYFGGYLARTYGLRAPYPVIAGLSVLFVLIQCVLLAFARQSGGSYRTRDGRGPAVSG